MGFRVLDQDPQFFSADGTALLVGGSVTFYESGTSVLQDTYTDPTLATPNSNPLVINAQGRIDDVWGNGNYRMVVADAGGNIQWTRDNVQGPASLPSQAGNAGNFLTTDGVNLSFAAVKQPLDPTGQAGKVMGSDGTNPIWVAPAVLPALPVGGVTASAGQVMIGKVLIQWGTATAPSSGIHTTGVSVNFPTAYATAPFVSVNRAGALTVSGLQGTCGAGSIGPTQFYAEFDININNSDAAFNITSPVPFGWFAIGMAP